MLAKYESHKKLRLDRLCPFLVHYKSRAFNAVCNWHPNLEVILVLDGNGHMQYGADTLSIQSGDILIINPNVLHRCHRSEDMIYHCIIIDEAFCAENGILTDQLLFVRHFRDARTEALCKSIADSYRCYQSDKTPLNGAKARHSVLSLLVDLCENHSADPKSIAAKEKGQSHSEMYVKIVASYLEEHCYDPVSLDQLAQLCGISKCHLSREFKRYTGQTVLTYVNLIRCMHAQQRLASGMTVTEAALESGFESVSYFSRTYKKLMGSVPSKEK